MSILTNVTKAHPYAWPDRFSGARKKLLSTLRNARHIECLFREPKTISPEGAASLVRTVNLLVEARCNIVCSCCHYFATRNAAAADRSFDLTRMLAMIDEVPNAVVGITGGEPLMSPDRVAEAARALLARGRITAVVTNSLPLTDIKRGELARGILLNGLSPAERAKLRIRCSIDLQHQVGSRLALSEYINRCHAAIRFLKSSGFPVHTRSIVTTREEYEFFKEHVLPLSISGVTLGASVQPDMYDLAGFAAAFQRKELGDVGVRIGSSYLKHILHHVGRTPNSDPRPQVSTLPAAPWALIEVSAQGVKGPSCFLPSGTHHHSVLEMLRSYDWLPIVDSMVPQITITQNAFPYRIDRRNRAVSLNLRYIVGKMLRS